MMATSAPTSSPGSGIAAAAADAVGFLFTMDLHSFLIRSSSEIVLGSMLTSRLLLNLQHYFPDIHDTLFLNLP